MHTADKAVGLEHDITARRRHQRSGIINKPKGSRMLCQRAEVARDQALFAG
jgi:hypothetical protein